MATNLLPPFIPRPDQDPRKDSPPWWTPLFGWSFEQTYLDSANLKFPRKTDANKEEGAERSRLRSVQFTEEKARLLRMMTADAGSSHHEMYHSAIAARMASDFGILSDP